MFLKKKSIVQLNLLDAPPSAMKTVLQNRWFSESFREQALNKAVSYALKVRRATSKVIKSIIKFFNTFFLFSIKMDF